MVRCKHCGAENYAIDMWCATCSRHLDWEPSAAPGVTAANSEVASAAPAEPVAAATDEPGAATIPAAATEAEAARVPAAEPQPTPIAAAAPVAATTERPRQRAAFWLLAAAAAAIVAVLLALPVAGWFRAAGRQSATPQLPLTAGLTAKPTATLSATPIPTPSESPTPAAPVEPAAPPPAAQPNDQQPVPVPAFQTTVGDPAGEVAAFYQAVQAHQFDAAAATWSAQMQSSYPPAEFINHRFAYTQQMSLRANRTLANNGQAATVYIDLIEVYAGSTRHWVGTWQLVRSSSGWLLNQPNLRSAG